MDRQLRALLQQIPADADRRRLPRVIGVGLEGEPEIANRLPVTVPNNFCTTNRAIRCCQVFKATTDSQ